jgi:8-oxo-dGTP diphosphatase
VAHPAREASAPGQSVAAPLDGLKSAERRIHLVTGVLRRGATILMVASRYPNHERPLWNLPGGRQESGELLGDALRREFKEETGLEIAIERVAYVSESYDRKTSTHFLNVTFVVHSEAEPVQPSGDLHAVACEWVPIADVPQRLRVGVVREPLCAFLAGDTRDYFGYADAGITVEFSD